MSAIPRDTRDYTSPSILDQPLRLSWANLEIAAFILLMALSIFAHLWQLYVKAMHHDESVTSWRDTRSRHHPSGTRIRRPGESGSRSTRTRRARYRRRTLR